MLSYINRWDIPLELYTKSKRETFISIINIHHILQFLSNWLGSCCTEELRITCSIWPIPDSWVIRNSEELFILFSPLSTEFVKPELNISSTDKKISWEFSCNLLFFFFKASVEKNHTPTNFEITEKISSPKIHQCTQIKGKPYSWILPYFGQFAQCYMTTK